MNLLSSLRTRVAKAAVKFLKLGGYGMIIGGQGEGEESKDTSLFESVYTGHVWAYAGIYAIAAAAAGLPIKMMRQIGPGEVEEVTDHRFLELLESPNEFMTGYDLIELAFIFAESTGSFYWLLDNGESSGLPPGQELTIDQIKEIWPIPSQFIKPRSDKKDFIKDYSYNPGLGKTMSLQKAEIIYFRYANPTNLWIGLSSLQPAKADIMGDLMADKFNNAFFKNNGVPAAFLKTEQNLTPDQRTEMRAEWAKLYQGIRNAHKVAILDGGLDLAIPTQTRKDMEFVELGREKRSKILGALGVPPVMVGIDTAKYDNAEQQKAIFWEITMLPKLRKLERFLTKRLHQLGEDKDLFIVFDTSGVRALQGDYQKQAITAKFWWQMGIPANELIPVFGPPNMEQFEGGDESYPGGTGTPSLGLDFPIEPEGTQDTAPPPGSKSCPGKDHPNKAIDTARWKKFIVDQEPFTRKLRQEIKKLFAAQGRKIIAKINKTYKAGPIADQKAGVQVYLLNVHDESATWTKKLKPIVRSILEKFGGQTVQEFATGIDFSIHNPRAVAFLDHHVPKFTFEVNDVSMERTKLLISEKIRLGATQSELTDAIKEEFGFYDKYRAARIARTESGIAGNAGINEGFIQAGVEKKRWISSRDEKVRASHEAADGQEIPVGDPFEVGGFMLEHPGDPGGPPEEIINCRCTMVGSSGE
jgi:HK97 family phage portal protein